MVARGDVSACGECFGCLSLDGAASAGPYRFRGERRSLLGN